LLSASESNVSVEVVVLLGFDPAVDGSSFSMWLFCWVVVSGKFLLEDDELGVSVV